MIPLLQQLSTRGVDLDQACLDSLFRRSEVLERVNRTGEPKVLRLPRPSEPPLIVKLWYPKSGPSSEWLVTYATRFRRHAQRLRARAVVAPVPIGWGRVEGTRTRFVCYPEIPGRTLRDWIPDADLEAAGTYVAGLHERGVDFRSLHMGNILQSDDGTFGLIDVTDCYFPRFMLRRRRLRRLCAFCGHRMERPFLLAGDNWTRFVRAYCERAGMNPAWMLEHVARHLGTAGKGSSR